MKIALDPTPFHHSHTLLEFPRLAAELGFEHLQLTPHRDFIPFYRHPRADDALVAALRREVAAAGITIASVLAVQRWSGPDEVERAAAVRHWKRIIQITVDLGVEVINTEFSGRPERSGESDDAFYASMEELLPIIEHEGIDVRIDPHPDDFVEDALEALRVIRGLNSPNVGFVYVASHTFHYGHPAAEVFEAAGELLRLVHVSTPSTTPVPTVCGTSPTHQATPRASTSTSGSETATSTGTPSSPAWPDWGSPTATTRCWPPVCSPRTRTRRRCRAFSWRRSGRASPRPPAGREIAVTTPF